MKPVRRRCTIRARLPLTGFGLLAILVGCVWYTAAPPLTAQGYRHEARQTLSSFSSQLATAQLWGRELQAGRSPLRTTRTGLAELETDAGGTLNRFAAYEPVGGQTELRSQVVTLGDQVEERLAQLRIAARAGRTGDVVQEAAGLDELRTRTDTALGALNS
ncbi:hypothetical protein ACIB24_00140 [Spongisporangium articulatum]|uniref:Uncharacterized protein n=1 Tax=Spongisporangium articulatum TaxID=3362603 RepID=A0ABW8AGH4_9ACTN